MENNETQTTEVKQRQIPQYDVKAMIDRMLGKQ
jgi:hypothetical protein